jgi:Protein of unknown function (DUF3016)
MTRARNLPGRAATFFVACLVAPTSVVRAAEPPHGAVEVVYVDSKHFTDVADSKSSPDSRRDGVLSELRTYFEERAAPRIPTDSTLTIEVTDIDRAGAFELWRGPQADHIRIVEDIYPPHIRLAFHLVDANGHAVADGTRDLTDQGFLMNVVASPTDPLRYEKRLVDDWVVREFPKSPKR